MSLKIQESEICGVMLFRPGLYLRSGSAVPLFTLTPFPPLSLSRFSPYFHQNVEAFHWVRAKWLFNMRPLIVF